MQTRLFCFRRAKGTAQTNIIVATVLLLILALGTYLAINSPAKVEQPSSSGSTPISPSSSSLPGEKTAFKGQSSPASVEELSQAFNEHLGQRLSFYRSQVVDPQDLVAILTDDSENSPDSQLWEEYLALVAAYNKNKINCPYYNKLWLLFFNQAQFATSDLLFPFPIEESDMDEAALKYLLSFDDVNWLMKNAAAISSYKYSLKDDYPNMPPKLQALYPQCQPQLKAKIIAEASAKNQPPSLSLDPVLALRHLLLGSFSQDRADKIFRDYNQALKKAGCNLQGKDYADIGSGCGMVLKNVRQAIGPEANLYAQEIEIDLVDMLEKLNSQYQVKAVKGAIRDCALPENSCDVVSLIGVHMGSGLQGLYETETLPWLKSIRKALRPNGYLVIDEGNMELLDQGLVKKVEAAGFVKVSLTDPKKDHKPEFVAVFKVKK